jgi:O-antigen ligase
MGVIGLLSLIAYMLVPALAALGAARNAENKELGLLAAAAAAAGFIATVTSGTFDSLSFQTFALLVPFFIGLSGASWLMVKNQLGPHRADLSWVGAGEVPGG